ncbi:ABC transporter permease [uncultured Roseibium sp.]|uniref:ABC transporter permease n=1 Tax=uncultured Roseibium sp. TaxID=1936171 RepID=UPI0032166F9C
MKLINRKPSRRLTLFLGLLPFAALLVTYLIASDMRLAVNPSDKLLPSFETMANTMSRMAFEPDKRNGDYLLWTDTAASLYRLFAGLAISAVIAIVIGLAMGVLPVARAFFAQFTAAFSLIPPITVLPILFITLGLGEAAKIGLIIVGTTPAMIRTLAQSALDIPRELVIKAETLGASSWQITTRLYLPHILPNLLVALRLGLVPAWIFLISAEAIASTEGLGYRIFLVRRYMAMDLILPYVAWITLLAFILDRLLLILSKRAFSWNHLEGDSL